MKIKSWTLLAALFVTSAVAIGDYVLSPLMIKQWVPQFYRLGSPGTTGVDPALGTNMTVLLGQPITTRNMIVVQGCLSCSLDAINNVTAVASIVSDLPDTTLVVVCELREEETYELFLSGIEDLQWKIITVSAATKLNLEYSPRLYVFDARGDLEYLQFMAVPIDYYRDYITEVY